MKLLDTVRLNQDLPNEGLRAGAIGVIVEVYTTPDCAYEVEFVNDDGSTRAMRPLRQEQLDSA
ncbi:DUF4926 domain-containing protein [Deinococcus ficus]|uniref:DUF4926 domain-containing protein n=1 Tax=Deinococcus ficus TaxID=317577 RepID=UPI0003B3816F|nr:DUF4926 domain-containing protein [Deinococcus ficus]